MTGTASSEPRLEAFRPLVAETAAARIADRFVTAIALGQFVVGQKLPTIQRLSQMLEVSPTTIREAIGRLAALGYVSVQRGRHGGTVVTSQWGPVSGTMVRRALVPEWERLAVTLDFRSLIEQQIARTAAVRHDEEDARQILGSADRYEAAEDDRGASFAADLALHSAIADATHNHELAALSLRLRREVSLGFGAEPYSPQVRAKAVEQHHRLARAIVERRPDDAAACAEEHMGLTSETIGALRDRILGPQSADEHSPH